MVKLPAAFAGASGGLPSVRLTSDPLQQIDGHDQNRLARIEWHQANPYGTAENHPGTMGKIAHVLSVAGNIAGNIFAPNVMANIPGTQMNMQAQEGGLAKRLNTEVGEESANQYRNAETAKTTQDTAQIPLTARRQNAQLSESAGEQGMKVDQNGRLIPQSPEEFSPGFKSKQDLEQAQIYGLKNPWGKLPGNEPLSNAGNLQKSLQDRYNVLNPGKPLPQEFSLPLNATKNDYERVDKSLESVEKATGTVAQQQQATAMRQEAMAMARERLDNAEAKGSKPTADEQRRADLSENLNENLGTLRDIVMRRPELFGPLAGRWAELKQKFGSDDPDLGTLQTIEHQIGMAQISAHGMRSAQGVQTAANSILNNLHSGPHSILASIDAAQNSVKTFQGDVDRATGKTSSQPQAAPTKAGPKAGDSLGLF